MLEEHKSIIKDSIKDAFDFRNDVANFEINNNFQLLTSQLDLFKVIASLAIGIASIGYLYSQKLDSGFLLVSIIFSIISLIMSVSYTRETIDLQARQNKETRLNIFKKTDEMIEVALKALKENNADIYFNYAEERVKDRYPEPQLNYIGEIVIFMFYSSIGFLILSYPSKIYGFEIISIQSFILLATTYLLSFKDWVVKIAPLLSTELFKGK